MQYAIIKNKAQGEEYMLDLTRVLWIKYEDEVIGAQLVIKFIDDPVFIYFKMADSFKVRHLQAWLVNALYEVQAGIAPMGVPLFDTGVDYDSEEGEGSKEEEASKESRESANEDLDH